MKSSKITNKSIRVRHKIMEHLTKINENVSYLNKNLFSPYKKINIDVINIKLGETEHLLERIRKDLNEK